MKQMPLHKAGVSQWWTYALTLVYSTLPPLPTPPRQCKTRPNINAGWCCSAIGDVGPITVSDYAIHAPNCTLTIIYWIAPSWWVDCCRKSNKNAAELSQEMQQSIGFLRFTEVKATCNHTAIVIVGVADGYSGNAETSHQPVLERVWTLIQCWFGWLLQKDQYWWALMSSQATIKTTINPYLEFFSYLRKGRKRSEDLRHRTCKKGQGICNNQPMQINLNITQLLSFCYVILNATKNYISI